MFWIISEISNSFESVQLKFATCNLYRKFFFNHLILQNISALLLFFKLSIPLVKLQLNKLELEMLLSNIQYHNIVCITVEYQTKISSICTNKVSIAVFS